MLGAATASALALTAPAQAADTPPEVVVVTGSHIPQIGIYSSSPVTALGDHELKLQGTTNISGALQSLPSVVNDGDGETVNNGTSGIATVDLRNLGTKRTLVLVDGKRLVAADASLNVDTNQIPAAMVERIEVLTGGASAVYGSDAVSGVVNIILKKDFEGLTFDTQFSTTDHSDGDKTSNSFLLGMNSGNGKGNLTIYGEYSHRDGILGSARDFSTHALAATNYTGCAAASPATHFGGFCYSGSGSIPEGRVTSKSLGGPTAGTTTMFTAGGGIATYDKRAYNFAPYQYLQTPGQRYSFGANGHYQVTPGIDFYTRLTFSNNFSHSQLGPSPMTANFNINCGNPMMSGAVRQAIFGTTTTVGTIAAQCATVVGGAGTNITLNADPTLTTRLVGLARRLVEAGPRNTIQDHEAFQIVMGARGGLGMGWNYDFSAQYGHSNASFVLQGDALKGNFQNGLLVTGTSPATATCISGGSCSPLNFFTPAGLTAANVAYIREDLLNTGVVEQWDVQATATGDLGFAGIQSPFAKQPVGVALGVEYRQEESHFYADHNLATGNLVGYQSSVSTGGGFNVGEGYLEMRIPLVEDAPFFQSLQLNAAYRYDHYNTAGDAHSYNIGLEWQPIDDLRFRAGFQRAVRAPNVSELFTPAGGTSANPGRDPCGTASSVVTTSALCQATGVPAGSVFTASLDCPTNQCQAAVGGNPFLKPETSDSWTVGVVLTPSFLQGFSATLDFYQFKIGGFIAATPIATILANCYSTTLNPTQSAANPYCSFIHRDALGTIKTNNQGYVISAEGNIAGDKVQGFDAELNYDLDLNDLGWEQAGSLSFNAVGTLVTVNNTEFPGAPIAHCAGLWGSTCGEPQNRFKSNVRVTWTDNKGDFGLSLRWRHISGAKFELNADGAGGDFLNPGTGFPFVNTPTLEFAAVDYFDLSGTWSVTDGVDLRAGVRNLFDKDPPVTDNNTAPASDVNNNTFPNTYDALGRVIFVGATVKL
jgi:outer membrane receptor protein involved in Fe transport